MAKDKYKSFARWVRRCLFDDTGTFDALHDCAFGEMALRRLHKLGLVGTDGEYWVKENGRSEMDQVIR